MIGVIAVIPVSFFKNDRCYDGHPRENVFLRKFKNFGQTLGKKFMVRDVIAVFPAKFLGARSVINYNL